MNNLDKINQWFAQFEHRMREEVPAIIAETATEFYKERFTAKDWDGVAWQQTKRNVSRGSLMVRSGKLVNSIRPSMITPETVRISAGSSKVPYARVHNEGGTITRSARSETFVRNRLSRGKNKGAFKRGTTPGQGFTFKDSSFNMPQRQFMGHSAILNKRIITRLKQAFNNR